MFKSTLEDYAEMGNKEIEELWNIPRADRKDYIKKHRLYVCFLDDFGRIGWSSMNRGF